MYSLAFRLSVFLGLLPDFRPKNIPKMIVTFLAKWAVVCQLIWINYNTVKNTFIFESFNHSVIAIICIFMAAASCSSYFSLFFQYSRASKLIASVSATPRIPSQRLTSNILFITMNLIELLYFGYLSYLVSKLELSNPFVNLMFCLLDFTYADFLFYLQDMIAAVTIQLKCTRLSNRALWRAKIVEKLRILTARHSDIIDIYEEMNDVFCVANICSVCFCTVEIVFTLFINIENLASVGYILDGLFWVFYYSTKLLFVAHASSSLVKKVIKTYIIM